MKANKLAGLVLAVALLAPGLAHAYPKQGWYMQLGGGVGFQTDSDTKVAGITNRLEFNPGFAVTGSVGYGFENQLRPEFEVSYRRNNVDKVSGTGAGSRNGYEDAIGFMGNLFYDFDTHTGLTPYLGAGAGVGLVGANDAGKIVGGTTLDSQDTQFAYQGIAGLSYEITERLDIFADYRYFATLDPEFNTKNNLTATDNTYQDHTFMMGLRYVFGVPHHIPEPVAMRTAPRPVNVVPAPIMPPQPVVQAPPPPPAVPETYMVFFDFDKYYLTPEAKETLDRASDAYARGGNPHVEVTGHTDTSGSNRYNKRLSDRRARVVKEYMMSRGVRSDDIMTRGAGETELMVPTANNVREAKNRRAEIILRQ